MTHSFLKRVLANKEIKYDEEGRFIVLKIPVFVFSLNLLILMQKAFIDEFGEKGSSIFYTMLEVQSAMGARIMRNRFGYNKEKGIKEQIGQAEMIGAGTLELVKADFKNDVYILHSNSAFANEYKKTLGLQKSPVDVLLRGGLTGMFREQCQNKDMICIETSCIASGQKYCEFVVQDKSKFDLNDPNIISQIPPKFKFNFDEVIDHLGMPIR